MSISQLSLADEEFKSAFVDGKFVLDCLEIRLTQNSTPNPLSYVVPGYVYVNPQDGVQARIVRVRPDDELFDRFSEMKRVSELRSGRMIPDSHYFALEVIDIAGNRWTNPKATLRIEGRTKADVLTVTCDYLQCEFDDPGSIAYTNMVLLEELEFPMTGLDQIRRLVRGSPTPQSFETFSAGVTDRLEVFYDARKGFAGKVYYSELFAKERTDSQIALTAGFDEHLLEATRFVTATLFWPVMVETRLGGKRILELSKSRPISHTKMIQAPLDPRGHEDDFYRMLGRYFEYACKASSQEDLTPIPKMLDGLFALGGVWADTVALVVSVTIESLLGQPAFDRVGAVDARVVQDIDAIFAAVRAQLGISEAVRNRAIGAMSRMKSTGTRDKLKALAGAAALKEHDPAVWSKLRNSAAHGTLRVDPEKLQGFLDNVHASITIVYKIVFLLIGYSGKYTDYSEHGWSSQQFDACNYWRSLAPPAEPAFSGRSTSDPDIASSGLEPRAPVWRPDPVQLPPRTPAAANACEIEPKRPRRGVKW